MIGNRSGNPLTTCRYSEIPSNQKLPAHLVVGGGRYFITFDGENCTLKMLKLVCNIGPLLNLPL